MLLNTELSNSWVAVLSLFGFTLLSNPCFFSQLSTSETQVDPTGCPLQSIGGGWNVIDTASNYRDGRAETAIGRALLALRLTGDAQRSQLFLSTKAGYPPGGCVHWLAA
jgi:predicted aldo/keto reductase-like oxidoreductase